MLTDIIHSCERESELLQSYYFVLAQISLPHLSKGVAGTHRRVDRG